MRRPLLLAALGSLVRAGYLAVGNLQFRDEVLGEVIWEGWASSVDAHLADIAAFYDPENFQDTSWAWVCWFDLTPAGERILASLPEPDDRYLA